MGGDGSEVRSLKWPSIGCRRNVTGRCLQSVGLRAGLVDL